MPLIRHKKLGGREIRPREELFEGIVKHSSDILEQTKKVTKAIRQADAKHKPGETIEIFGHPYNRYGSGREENILRLRQQIYVWGAQ